jgi:hypothetical protein
MGHADRSRFNNAFSLDAESRRLRLSVADRRHSYSHAHANSDTYRNTYRDTNCNSHCDSDGYSNTYTQADSNPKAWSNAKAQANTATARIADS